jgi:hypothetical protein
VAVIVTLTIRDDRVVHIDALADPAKLGSFNAALGV